MADTTRKKVLERDSGKTLNGADSVDDLGLEAGSVDAFPGFDDFEEAQETRKVGGQYSLDDFSPDEPKRVAMPEGEAAPESAAAPKPPAARGGIADLLRNRRIQMLIAGVILVVAGTVVVLLNLGDEDPEKPVVTMVTRAITIPVIHEKVEFVLVSKAREERGMIVLTLEMEFRNPEKHRRFLAEDVLYRDVLYRFLEAQRPSKNTVKEWQPIVQKDLLAHLKDRLPDAAADQVRVERLERM